MKLHALLVLPLAAACACPEPAAQPEPKLVPAAGETQMEDLPVERNGAAMAAISAARCDREESCERMGAARAFERRHQCLTAYNTAGYDWLESESCGLIDKTGLIECLQAIETESCSTVLRDVGQLDACTMKRLCPTPTPPF